MPECRTTALRHSTLTRLSVNPPSPALRQVFYVSRVRPGLRDADIADILSESRRRNRTRDITGALTVTDRHFGQFIEGHTVDLEPLLVSLARDPRHLELKVLVDRPSGKRFFSRWSMGFTYRLELGEHLERLFRSDTPADPADLAMIFRLGPDSLMGALT